jgi:hypothetical protein
MSKVERKNLTKEQLLIMEKYSPYERRLWRLLREKAGFNVKANTKKDRFSYLGYTIIRKGVSPLLGTININASLNTPDEEASANPNQLDRYIGEVITNLNQKSKYKFSFAVQNLNPLIHGALAEDPVYGLDPVLPLEKIYWLTPKEENENLYKKDIPQRRLN